MSERDTDSPPTLDIDWLKTTAGALAAVTTAVLLSTLGAVGTLIGAALGSVAATVGSALYAQGLARASTPCSRRRRPRCSRSASPRRRYDGPAGARASEQEAHLDLADERLDEAKDELDEAAHEPAQPSWRDRFVALPWRRIGLLAAGTFAVVVLSITAFEALTGESVSSHTGGSDRTRAPPSAA